MRVLDGFSPAAAPTPSSAWVVDADTADDSVGHVKGFASTTSVMPGQAIAFHISVARPQAVTVEVYRVGDYDGETAALLGTSSPVPAVTQPAAVTDPATGLITCPWAATCQLRVPSGWRPGAYLALLRTEDGHANHVPFTVRGRRRKADWLVVLPFATYQAYNMYPFDGVRGKNLYYGFDGSGAQTSKLRASSVSFQRPYELTGMPREADRVHDFIVWAERQGYDLDYAASHDLHLGRVKPLNHKGLIFPGHDEYWSAGMRRTLQKTLDAGVSAVFLQANNAYWHIRLDGPTITCFKSRADPIRNRRPGQTVMWRDLRLPEQQLIGAQYVSVVKDEAPLVAKNADHWFWRAGGVAEGESFPGLVGGEADSVQDKYPKADSTEFVVLAESPYTDGAGGAQTQQTVLRRAASGSWVFDAGTFNWPMALGRPGFADARIQAATAALLARIADGDGLGPPAARRAGALAATLRREASPAAVNAVVKPYVKRVGRKVKHTVRRTKG
jgi:hypothetical protein